MDFLKAIVRFLTGQSAKSNISVAAGGDHHQTAMKGSISVNKSSLRRMLLRAGAVASAMAVAAGVAVVGGAGVATASAGTACASGYVCLFARYGNVDHQERFFTDAIPDYTTWQWGTYDGGWHLIPNTSINNDVDAVNYNWRKDQIIFYDQPGKIGYITDYLPGESGYRNWTAVNINRASMHSAILVVP